MGPAGMNVPPSIANNPNIPPDVIHALQAGRLGTTVFVANVRTAGGSAHISVGMVVVITHHRGVFQLDFKVGWKKLKEVFGMAGLVKRADVKEDKDGKSRGMGTVTFEQSLEAVQAICIL